MIESQNRMLTSAHVSCLDGKTHICLMDKSAFFWLIDIYQKKQQLILQILGTLPIKPTHYQVIFTQKTHRLILQWVSYKRQSLFLDTYHQKIQLAHGVLLGWLWIVTTFQVGKTRHFPWPHHSYGPLPVISQYYNLINEMITPFLTRKIPGIINLNR